MTTAAICSKRPRQPLSRRAARGARSNQLSRFDRSRRQASRVRNLALADATDADVRAMLAENETLFVEHKAALGGEGFNIAKAVCSFANTLGGWVLVGVTDGEPNAETENGWTPVAPHDLTDRVREALATSRVDPIPAFAATVREYGDERRPIGLIRVYESVDTPHVMGNGQVFVRSVAQDTRVVAGGVETQAVLLSLVERGRAGVERAREKFDLNVAPVASRVAGFVHGSGTAWAMQDGPVSVRAVPIVGHRLAEWAVSQRAATVLGEAARVLAQGEADHDLRDAEAYPSGVARSARTTTLLSGSSQRRSGVVRVGADTACVIAACISLGAPTPPPPKSRITLVGLRDELVLPLLEAVVTVLEQAELFGRVLLELRVGRLEHVIDLDDDGGVKTIPSGFQAVGELSLPLDQARAELRGLAEQWRTDVGRAAGYLTLRP